MRQRDKSVDILKGIAIILMVIGHSGFSKRFEGFVYLFHMAVFIIASGYCYSEFYSTGSGLLLYAQKRVKALYCPYVGLLSILVLAHNFILSLNIYTVSPEFLEGNLGNDWGIGKFYTIKETVVELLKVLLLAGGEQLAGATWFIRVLFYMSLMWCAIDNFLVKFCRKYLHVFRVLISGLFMVIGWSMMQYNFLNTANIPNLFTSYSLFTIGVYLRKLQDRKRADGQSNRGLLKNGCLAIMAGSILYVLYRSGVHISMVAFDSPLLFLAASCAGWIFLNSASKLILQMKNQKGAEVLAYFGRNTMPVLLFHLICFKLVTLLEVVVYKLPWYRLASYPIYMSHPVWWVLYTMSGLFLPLGVSEGWRRIKIRLEKGGWRQ